MIFEHEKNLQMKHKYQLKKKNWKEKKQLSADATI